jgi:hypothetical protein
LKHTSIKKELVPEKKPENFILKKEYEIPSKPKPPYVIPALENNLFINRPGV